MLKRLIACLCTILFITSLNAENPVPPARSYYEIKIYHLANKDQEAIVDQYLKNAFLPAMHRQNIKSIGVFKPVGNDTAAVRKIYVLIPYKSLTEFQTATEKLQKDKAHAEAGAAYINANYKQPVYSRIETVLLRAFEGMPTLTKPKLDNTKEDNVYELRSYEGHTEKIYKNKVEMFHKGEFDIFNKLNFNAVFYGEVLAGPRMPNLMYMTSFNNKQERDDHWKAFSADPDWKILAANPNYQNNVAKNVITFLTPVDYSDL